MTTPDLNEVYADCRVNKHEISNLKMRVNLHREELDEHEKSINRIDKKLAVGFAVATTIGAGIQLLIHFALEKR